MHLIRGLHNLQAHQRGWVATIGNFDGVHLGHREVIDALMTKACELGLPSLIILFEPQPIEFFRPGQAPARLTRLREKLALLRDAGVDSVLLLKFNPALAAMPAEDFVGHILGERLGVRFLYVGDDFRFGKGRTGDFDLLQRMGGELGFHVSDLPTFTHGGERVSSTRVREALAAGRLGEAENCLGRGYALCGRVSHGHKKGRDIGFPTINIPLLRQRSPVHGIYAVRVHGLDATALPGVANVGNRPVLEGDDSFLLEVHLFDFDRQVYGELVRVEFVAFIREECHFDSFDALREQIEIDADDARRILGLPPASRRRAI